MRRKTYGARRAALFGAILLSSLLAGCKEKKQGPVDSKPEELPLLDPDERPRGKLGERCGPLTGSRSITLRARSATGGTSSSIEVGGASAFADGFVVGGLRGGGESHALVMFMSPSGQERQVELGRVHGDVEAPAVATRGTDVFALVPDNDAAHTRLRLVKISNIAKEPALTWGPEVRARRGETAYFGLAISASESGSGLLVWDDFDTATSRSRILALGFSATAAAVRVEQVVSPADDDAVWPRIASRDAGYWLTWLSYRQTDKATIPSPDGPLVEEPPRVLRVLTLDAEGKPLGPPLEVTPPSSHVLAYEVAAQPNGELLVVSRLAQGGAPLGSIDVRSVGSDGSIASTIVTHDELGPGSPLVLSEPGSATGSVVAPAWVLARGQDQELLFGPVRSPLALGEFLEEPALEGKIPLARAAEKLLVMEPDRLDLRLSVYQCSP